MRKLSLFGIFILVTIFVSQLENLENAINALLLNGIPVTFYATMLLSLAIMVSLWQSLKYIRKIGKDLS